MSKKPFNYDTLTYIMILKKLKIEPHLNEIQVDERNCQPQTVICWFEIQNQKPLSWPLSTHVRKQLMLPTQPSEWRMIHLQDPTPFSLLPSVFWEIKSSDVKILLVD